MLRSVYTSFVKLKSVFSVKFLGSSLVKRISYLLHKIVIEIEVMKNCKAHAKSLLSLKEMTDIGARIVLTSRASALIGNRSSVRKILLVIDVYLTVPGEEISVSCIS